MFCHKCGKEISDVAKFCNACGAKLSSLENDDENISVAGEPKKPFKKSQKIIIVVITLLIVALISVSMALLVHKTSLQNQEDEAKNQAISIIRDKYGSCENLKIIRGSGNSFFVKCKSNDEDEIFDISYSINFMIYDNGEDIWKTDSWNIEKEYTFAENDNYYYCFPKLGENTASIIRFQSIDESGVDMECRSYGQNNDGSDYYDHSYKRASFEYDASKDYLYFEYSGHWRVYSDRIEYAKDSNIGLDYSEITPINPSDYWWFNVAEVLG